MKDSNISRRKFLTRSVGATVGGGVWSGTLGRSLAEDLRATRSPNERWRIGAIGMRYQGTVIAKKALAYGDVVALCDCDRAVAEKAKADFGGKAVLYGDHRDMLARDDLDVITIGTPDHWHTAMVIDACRAGKDVYCEKPLTLTIDEGKQLTRVVRATGRVVQVGSWQRSDHRFRLACEMVRQGRIGQLRRVDVVLGPNKTGGPFRESTPPPQLDWDRWQGQTPAVPYIKERCHYTFRWWYEYSGGQMTDWGAHHLDIAQWGIGAEASGPVRVEGSASYPNVPNGYNVATRFEARYHYANGVVLSVKDRGRNGILFTGSDGRLFVNRGTIAGAPVEALAGRPLPRDAFRLYAHDNLDRPPRQGKLDAIKNHMGNFYDCVASRQLPISDVFSQHRSVTVCHLGNIAMRLGRPLAWDPRREQFIGDAEADGLLARPQRDGYRIEA